MRLFHTPRVHSLAAICCALALLFTHIPHIGAQSTGEDGESDGAASGENWQGVMPQPSATSIPRQKTRGSAAEGRGDAARQANEGGNVAEQIESLKQQLQDANMRAQASAKRAEAANYVARTEMEKATQSQSQIKESRKRSRELVAEHQEMGLRVQKYESEVQEIKLRLQASEQRLAKAEAANRELTAQKGGLESNLQKLKQEHSVLLRRESAEKDTLRRAAEIVAKEAERQAQEERTSSATGAAEEPGLGALFSSWSSQLGKSAKHHQKRAALLWEEVSNLFNQSMTYLFGKHWKSAKRSINSFSARASRDAKRLSRWLEPLSSAYSAFEEKVGRAIGLTDPTEVRAVAVLLALLTALVGLVLLWIAPWSRTPAAPPPAAAATKASKGGKEEPKRPKKGAAAPADSAASSGTARPSKVAVGATKDTAASGGAKLISPKAPSPKGTASKQTVKQRKK